MNVYNSRYEPLAFHGFTVRQRGKFRLALETVTRVKGTPFRCASKLTFTVRVFLLAQPNMTGAY